MKAARHYTTSKRKFQNTDASVNHADKIQFALVSPPERGDIPLIQRTNIIDHNSCIIHASARMQVIAISHNHFSGFSINNLMHKSHSLAVWLYNKKKNPFKILFFWQKWIAAGGRPIRIWFQDPEQNRSSIPLEVRIINHPLKEAGDDSIWLVVKYLTEVWHQRERSRAVLRKVRARMEEQAIDFASWLHDWKGPLSTIESSTWLCLRYHTNLEKEKQIRHLKKMAKAVQEMKIGMLDWQTWHQPPTPRTIKRVDMVALIEERIAQLILKPGQTINFWHQGNTYHNTDPFAMKHILDNLLSNASKYSPDNTPICIKMWNAHSILKIAISDNGIGIPAGEMHRLYEVRYRASNALDMPGNGLGLATVHRLVKQLGGAIQLESQLNHGSTFVITIHNQLQSHEKSTDHRRQPRDSHQHRGNIGIGTLPNANC